jgi:2-methylisocitrate lyase-like PEP mutase family enzyme
MTVIADATHGVPLNVMVVPGLPTFEELTDHGVRRISTGTAIAQAALGTTTEIARSILSAWPEANSGAATADYDLMNKILGPESTRR